MFKHILFVGFLFSFSFVVSAQDFTIQGHVQDTLTQQPLEAATVYIESLRDSSLITYSITDMSGDFVLEGKTAHKSVNLFVSYNGYAPIVKRVELKPGIDLGNIGLREMAQELEGVQVVGERIPMQMKQDTLEFNAGAFTARPDANVEDLLKKLPGVEIDADGNITVNGKEVDQILVDGKVFFSGDGQMATKNLPKEIIDRIQVVDTRSENDAFVGKQSESDTKTINLTIKKDMKKGLLGRIGGGYGTDERYQGSGLINYFKGDMRLSAIGSANNINSPGFSFDEMYDMVGSSRNAGGNRIDDGGFDVGGLDFGFNRGLVTSSSIGGSYADELEKNTEVTANYFFAHSNSVDETKTRRENLLPDNRYITESLSHFEGNTDSHSGSGELEFELDSTLRIEIEPSFSYTKLWSQTAQESASRELDGTLRNTNVSENINDRTERSFSNQFSIVKRLRKDGEYMRLSLNNQNNLSQGTLQFKALQEVFGNNPEATEYDQMTDNNTQNDSYSLGGEVRKLLFGNWFLSMEYNFNNSKLRNKELVMDYDPVSGGYTQFNMAQSADFEFGNKRQNPGLGIHYRGEKLQLRVEGNYMYTELENEDAIQNVGFSNSYNNFLVNTRFRYNFNRDARIEINYRPNLRMPSARQLQPTLDVSNPSNLVQGNPDLDPTVSHRFSGYMGNYNWRERVGLSVFGSFTFEEDRIVSNTITDENFLRTTTFTNIDGNYNAFAGLRYSKQIKKDTTYTLRYQLRLNGNLANTVSMSNGVQFESKTTSIAPGLGLSFNYRDKLEVEPSYSVNFNSAKYELDNLDDNNFVTQAFTVRTTVYWPENLFWGNDLTYRYNSDVSEGFDKSTLFWNASLGYKIWKGKGIVKVLAYDLLNQNNNVRRVANADYIQDVEGTVLTQYFMGSFTYKFNQFGGKGGPPQDGGRGRRYRRY